MNYCTNCGNQLDEGTKFCANCGTPTTKDDGKRKTVYDGEIHKCPNCGEVLNSFVSSCPACGYELRGTKTSESVREFALKVSQAETDTQRTHLVRNFPIPNTKEDILEFIILASTNYYAYDKNEDNELIDAWLVKLEQCYQKAQIMFQNDSDFAKIQDSYNQVHKRIDEKEKELKNSSNKNLIIKNIGTLVGIAALIFSVISEIIIGQSFSQLIQLIGCIIVIISSCTLAKKNTHILDFAIVAASGGLAILLSLFLKNGSLLILSGTLGLIITAIMFFKYIGKHEHK